MVQKASTRRDAHPHPPVRAPRQGQRRGLAHGGYIQDASDHPGVAVLLPLLPARPAAGRQRQRARGGRDAEPRVARAGPQRARRHGARRGHQRAPRRDYGRRRVPAHGPRVVRVHGVSECDLQEAAAYAGRGAVPRLVGEKVGRQEALAQGDGGGWAGECVFGGGVFVYTGCQRCAEAIEWE